MVFNLITKNIAENLSSFDIMTGGKSNKVVYPKINMGYLFLVALVILIIKGFIVYILYNLLVPKIIYSLSTDKNSIEEVENNFRPISFFESILLVILTNTLFSS